MGGTGGVLAPIIAKLKPVFDEAYAKVVAVKAQSMASVAASMIARSLKVTVISVALMMVDMNQWRNPDHSIAVWMGTDDSGQFLLVSPK